MRAIAQRATDFVYAMWLEIILFCVFTTGLALWGFPPIYSSVIFVFFLAVVVPLNSAPVLRGIQRSIVDIRHDYWSAGLIVVCVALFAIWNIPLDSIAFLALFLFFLLYKWDSRIVATGALVSLASCLVLLVMNQNALAEQTAVYAYYFLVITVILQIVEYKRHPEQFEQKKIHA